MKTLEEIKTDILASNPSRIYIVNGEEFEQTDAEFEDAITKRAEYEYSCLIAETEKAKQEAEAAAKRQALLDKLGITEDEARLLLGGN